MNIEDIKKEIIAIIDNNYIKGSGNSIEYLCLEDLFEILDKHNNQPNYKKMWKELKNDNTESIEYGNRTVKDCILYKNRKMYLIEKKHGVEYDG